MIITWVIVGYLVLVIPVVEWLAYLKYTKQIAKKKFLKRSFYNSVFVELWTPVIGILILVLTGVLSLQDIGLSALLWNPFGINNWLFIGAIILVAIPVMMILLSTYNYIGIKKSPAFREAYIAAVKKKTGSEEQGPNIVHAILPTSKREKIQWTLVSFTAGITEEILFRGFLVFCFHYAFPAIPIPFLLLIQAIPFSLMHLYQGPKGVLVTFGMGLILGLSVMVFGSIVPGMVVHILLDFSSNLIELEQNQEEGRAVNV
jgi:uncharacterized protein